MNNIRKAAANIAREWDESKVRRDSGGKFASQGGGGRGVSHMEKKDEQPASVSQKPDELDLAETKKRLTSEFESMAEPMMQIEYSIENYNRLFPDSRIKTPLGIVKMGENQFKKLSKPTEENPKGRGRENLMGAMYQTLSDPITVIRQYDPRGPELVYLKTFRNDEKSKIKSIISVVVTIDDIKISISTHPVDSKSILRDLKKAGDVVYEKPQSPAY